MNEAAEQALSNFQHEQALSIAHAKRAENYLAQFLNLVSRKSGDTGAPTGQTVRCVREWTRWLADNGPTLKADIAEATGIKFSERGTPHTFLWDEDMSDDPDDALPPNAIVRIQGPAQPGRGRPPMIYFLWSQRWDVHPLFGVGPVKPDDISVETHDDGYVAAAPVVASNPIAMEPTFEDEVAALLSQPRCDTIEEWDEMHAATFDVLAATETKPTEEQKQKFRDTLPATAEPNASIAMAYRAAVMRAREVSPMLGVIQPPEEDE